ncbi:MAG: hypothetical protein AB1716_00275 [Planctomycetota bacterium]
MRTVAGLLVTGVTALFGLAQGPRAVQDEYGHRLGWHPAAPLYTDPGASEDRDAGDWLPLGPFGGDVEDIAASPANPSIVLAGLAPGGSSGGVLFRSTDAGATWTKITALEGKSVYGIDFTPAGAAFIATDDGMWKSTDGGAGWTQLNTGLGVNDTCQFVIVKPGSPNEVWAGVNDHLGAQPQNVIRSLDGGTTWASVTPPMSPMTCHSIAFSPANPSKVYASFGGWSGGGACWFSPDNGATWYDRSGGLPTRPLKDIVHDGTRVLVTGGQLFGSQNVGLYASSDDGQTWAPLHDGAWPILVLSDIALDPANPQIIYLASLGAGIYRSPNGGATWEFRVGGTGNMSLNAVRFAPGSSSTIFAGATSLGVLKSTNAGAQFVVSSVGIGALNVTTIAANPRNGNELAIGFEGNNSGGVYTSLDGGRTWALAAAPGTRYQTVRFHPDGTLYAVSTGPSSVAPEGVYRRNANGTWTCLGPDQGGYYESDLEGLCFAKNDPSLILAGGSDFGYAGWKMTMWLSTNAGANWTKVYLGPKDSQHVTDIDLVADGLDRIFVASYADYGENPQIGGVLRTSNGGTTWAASSAGLAATPRGMAIAAAWADVNRFYFGDTANPGGLYESTTAGQSWLSTGFQAPVADVQCDQNDPNVIYIMQQNTTRVLKSDDGGVIFLPFNAGLASAGTPQELNYARGKLLLATTTGAYARVLNAPGDLNCDGAVNFDDINPFVLALSDPAGYAVAYPNCNILNGDCNGDGVVNFDDINPFVALLTNP